MDCGKFILNFIKHCSSLTDALILAALDGVEIISISLAASINKLFTLLRCGIEEVM